LAAASWARVGRNRAIGTSDSWFELLLLTVAMIIVSSTLFRKSDHMEQNPPKLDYATRVGEYPDPKAHSGLAIFLIGTSALAGIWLVILAVCYALDLKIYATLLFIAGGGTCWATLHYLPAGNPRWRPALLLLTVALASETVVAVLADRDYRIQYALHGTALPNRPALRQLATTAEKEVFSFEMIRNGTFISELGGVMLWIYVGVRVARKS
jgi:hypothetical protein